MIGFPKLDLVQLTKERVLEFSLTLLASDGTAGSRSGTLTILSDSSSRHTKEILMLWQSHLTEN